MNNIPQGVDEEQMREMFSSYGELLKFKFLSASD